MQSVKSANEPKYSRRRMYVNEEWRRVYMSVCILFLVHTCMCACVCANLWVCVCVFMHSCMCVCVCVCVHTYVCLCVCVHVCVCLKVNMYMSMCFVHVCVCVCVCVCMHMCVYATSVPPVAQIYDNVCSVGAESHQVWKEDCQWSWKPCEYYRLYCNYAWLWMVLVVAPMAIWHQVWCRLSERTVSGIWTLTDSLRQGPEHIGLLYVCMHVLSFGL